MKPLLCTYIESNATLKASIHILELGRHKATPSTTYVSGSEMITFNFLVSCCHLGIIRAEHLHHVRNAEIRRRSGRDPD